MNKCSLKSIQGKGNCIHN